jgi:hypothetical protein
MTSEILAPPLYLAAGLLVVSGASKLRRPDPAARALYAAGVPAARAASRALGGAELLVGAVALVRPTPLGAAAVAATYAGFAGFLAYLKLWRPEASCGCAGGREVPPHGLHIALDLLAAAVGAGASLLPTPGIVAYVSELGLPAIPLLAAVGATGAVAAIVATEVPAALAAYRPPERHGHRASDGGRHERADEALAAAGITAGHASLWPGATPPGEAT